PANEVVPAVSQCPLDCRRSTGRTNTKIIRYSAQGINMKIAVIPGDGVGQEVIAESLKVLKVAAQKYSFNYSTTDYPFSGEYYLKTAMTLRDSALKELAAHDAIWFGAVGVHPRGS